MAMAEPVRVDKAYTEQDRRLISRRAAAVDGCRHDRAAVRDDERAEKGIPRFVLLRAAAAASAAEAASAGCSATCSAATSAPVCLTASSAS